MIIIILGQKYDARMTSLITIINCTNDIAPDAHFDD